MNVTEIDLSGNEAESGEVATEFDFESTADGDANATFTIIRKNEFGVNEKDIRQPSKGNERLRIDGIIRSSRDQYPRL